jgi:hypothetical protein
MATAFVTSNIADVREVVRNLQNELRSDPTLMKRYSNDPRTVLQEYGLARDVQSNLLREEHLNSHPNEVRCFCGSLWSIWTTITTAASQENN